MHSALVVSRNEGSSDIRLEQNTFSCFSFNKISHKTACHFWKFQNEFDLNSTDLMNNIQSETVLDNPNIDGKQFDIA